MSTLDISTELREGGVDAWLVDALDRLARNKERSLAPYLTSVGVPGRLADTRATSRCHFVPLDGNRRPQLHSLVRWLADQIVDYCIPRSRVDEAAAFFRRTSSTEKFSNLQAEAKDLFTTISKSGEGGEMLLYVLLEVGLGIPQLLCKMSLKTNAQMHVHGVDGIHAKALANGNLALYWGEAKLYDDVNAGIDAALSGIAPFLLDSGGGAAERDIVLLRDNTDTGDDQLTEALVRYFTAGTLEARRIEARGACLVGFSMSDYPDPFQDDGQVIRDEIGEAIDRWNQRIGTAIAKNTLASFEMEVFCVPMPSVQEFRDLLLRELGLPR